MEHGALDFAKLGWFAGWLVAVVLLFLAALRLPLALGLTRWRAIVLHGAVVAIAVLATALANVALTLNDAHVDLTREKIFTPSAQAMQVVDGLKERVRLTYFYRSQDPEGRRVKEVLGVMARRNPLFEVRVADPDKEPTLARSFGVRIYNAGILEVHDRKLLVQSSDEAEIAIGIQRVLREKVVTLCFLEGHNELPMDNFEYHTHVEGISDHSHGDASSQNVQMPDHGVGRLRRALEVQGYVARKAALATDPAVPRDCNALLIASPRTTFLPAESAAIEAYLRAGGSLFAMFDLGFVLEPRLASLVAQLGVSLPQEAIVDPLSHYSSDSEMVAVTGYETNPVTRNLSMTFFPGARPLTPQAPAQGIKLTPLFTSSRDSYTRQVLAAGVRDVGAPKAVAAPAAAPPAPGPRLLGAAAEGRLPGADAAAPPLRVVIVGDGDFASNSFLPYLANSDLALAIVRWLVREERGTSVASRIPVPAMVLLSGGQMRTIFLFVEVLLPLALFGIGLLMWWRRR
jgi:ABC-type uncharacterized transport system